MNINKGLIFVLFFVLITINVNGLAGWTLLSNMTFETADGWKASSFTCLANAASWSLSTTECNGGQCLRYAKGSGGGTGECMLNTSVYSWAKIDYSKSYLLQGWLEDEFNGGGGYPAIAIINTTATKWQSVGWHCDTPRTVKGQNGTFPTQVKTFTKSPCADVPIWTEVIFNHTTKRIGQRLCSDSTCGTILVSNWSMVSYQTYPQSVLGFMGYRDLNFDDLEFYTLDLTPPSPAGRLTIYAKNSYNGSFIKTFNATVSQGSNTTKWKTTTGIINISINSGQKANISVYYSNFLNVESIKNFNVSFAYTPWLHEAQRTFNAKEFITNTSITGITVYNNFYSNASKLYFDDGTFNITAVKSGYQNAKKTITVTELSNNTETFTFWRFLNISAKDIKTGNKINNFTLIFRSLNYSYSDTNTTTNNQILHPVVTGSYNLTITSKNYALYRNSQIIKINSTSLAQTKFIFNLYETNTFNITFVDEGTLTKIVTNVSLDLISGTYSANYSTTNGNIYASLLIPETYTIRYYGDRYQPRLSTYTLSNGTFNEFTLYLLSSSQNVTLNVVDEGRQPIENAQIKIYRYSVIENGYILVNTINTDYEGKAVVDLQKNSEFYKFYIYYDSTLKLSTTPAYVSNSELVFTINIDEPILQEEFKQIGTYTIQCDYNQVTRNFKFYYDTQGEASKGCIYLYKTTAANGESRINYSCYNGGSSVLLLKAANISGTSYYANGVITKNGKDYTVCSYAFTFQDVEFESKWGYVISIFLVLFGIFISIWSLPLGFILSPLGLVFASSMNVINIPVGVSFAVMIAGLILALLVSRRSG